MLDLILVQTHGEYVSLNLDLGGLLSNSYLCVCPDPHPRKNAWCLYERS
jgi:hypothetical protein